MKTEVRKARASDREGIDRVLMSAFGAEQGDEIRGLVAELLEDPGAEPLLSLVAVGEGVVLGYVLFTNVNIEHSQQPLSAAILAPLAVHAAHQNEGIGSRLVREGLDQLRTAGTGLVFVLGHPEYYPRLGFAPAGSAGFEAPYPIPAEHDGAWMVAELRPGLAGQAGGRVACAAALDDPRHWRE